MGTGATHGGDAHRDTRRRFEQWARNPQCHANTVSAVHNVPMVDVAKAEGLTPTMGQSPFAIQRGQSFERALFRNDGASIMTALTGARVLTSEASGLADFRLRMHGGKLRTLDEARARTAELFRSVAANPTGGHPWVVAGATVAVPGGVMLPEAILVLDVLVIRHDLVPPRLIVGEIKTYPDRAGYTDSVELATARAQAGVYVHGLELVLDEVGLREAFDVAVHGFLILTRPGYNRPSIRAGEDLRYQAARARRGFALLRSAAESLPKGEGHPSIDDVLQAPIEYSELCVLFCDRAPRCRALALEAGKGAVLGDEVGRFLGSVSLPRALELLGGAAPATSAEGDLARRMRDVEALRLQS